ncbi:MAG: Na+/H+ antiporter [Steroidobacteraceae bacterium]
MGTIGIALAMLAAVVLSGVLIRMLPFAVPTPLAQIALGAVIAAFSDHAVRLEPDIFFLLFLPPLLFLDGWRIPKEGLLRDQGMILELALGLVFCTVIGMGFFIHWMIPAMPLPVAFALAAIVSPTDPVAVSAITERVAIPSRALHVLEGESLLNDASGLVCFRFAVAAALTGSFSLPAASLAFVQLALGGVAIGAGLTFAVMMIKNGISSHFGEEAGSQVLISLLLPFAAYQAAEHAGCSGILAAVSAGITMSYMELSGRALGTTRMQRTAVWDTVQFALNGVMFVLLGEQLPDILSGALNVVQQSNHENPVWLVAHVLAINLGLAVLRFLWVWLSLRLNAFVAAIRGEPVATKPSLRLIGAVSVAGVRGAITLAGVLTLPLTLADGSPFPARDLTIFLAAGVIILSLIAANMFLPRLLRGLDMPAESAHEQEIDRAQVAAAEAAIRAIERTSHELADSQSDADLYAQAAARVMELYRRRIEGRTQTGESAASIRRSDDIERRIRLAGLRAERDTVFALARSQSLSDASARRLVREIDLLEERLTRRVH